MHPGKQLRGHSQRMDAHLRATEAVPAQSGEIPRHVHGLAGAWPDRLLSDVAARFLAVLVSFSGPRAIFYQAAQVARMSSGMYAARVWGISIGAGVAGVGLSWYLRAPVISAWSAPGTALLITRFSQLPLRETVGAYLAAALILPPIGLSGSLERIMARSGAILAPILIGTLVSMALPPQQNFQAMAIPAVIAAVSVALISHGRSASTASRAGLAPAASEA